MKSLSTAMNFTFDIFESVDTEKEKWGRQQLNGSVSGLLGEMVAMHADYALGDLQYTPYHLDKMDLTIPYYSECLTFITPESLSDNSWKTLILPFKLVENLTGKCTLIKCHSISSDEMWGGVLASLLSVGFVFYGLGKFHRYLQSRNRGKRKKFSRFWSKKNRKSETPKSSQPKKQAINSKDIFDDFSNCIMYTYSMLLLVSLPRLPRGWSIRILTGWYWIYCLLVAVSYRASMTAILANPISRVTIDTLDELANSPIGCGAWGEQIHQFFITSLDEAGQKIGEKLQHIDDVSDGLGKVINGEFAYYESVHFLNQLLSTTTPENRNLLHIMSECTIHMPISLGMQKNSPLKIRTDKFLRMIIETGE